MKVYKDRDFRLFEVYSEKSKNGKNSYLIATINESKKKIHYRRWSSRNLKHTSDSINAERIKCRLKRKTREAGERSREN